MAEQGNGQQSPRRRFAALDVGTNSIRLIVAEAAPDGAYTVIDDEKIIARLGAGLGETNRLDPERIEATAEACLAMRNIAESYEVDRLEAVATAAARQAENGEHFLQRVKDVSGVELRVIGPEEEARLAFRSVGRAFDLDDQAALIVDVGGGSTEIVVSINGVIEQVIPARLGAVQLTERFGSPTDQDSAPYHRMRRYVMDVLKGLEWSASVTPGVMYGAGGTFTALAQIAMHRMAPTNTGDEMLPFTIRGYELRRGEVRHVLDWLRKMSDRQRAAIPGLSPDRAGIIVAGVTIVDRVMRRFDVNRLVAHDGGIRDGLLLTMIDDDEAIDSHDALGTGGDRLRDVRRFAARCHSEVKDGQHVAGLAASILDQMRDLGMVLDDELFSPASRDILQAAALLRDVGYLVNYSKHHKHSYHLIVHSNIKGFSPREIELIANVARYHRRATPKIKHACFAKLSEDERTLVRRLAAVLRIADGLDRTHTQSVRGVRLTIHDGEARFLVSSDRPPSVNIWGAQRKARLFEQAFGLGPVFEWEGAAGGAPTSGAAPGPGVAASEWKRDA
jgi:exopolyphosphatase/guanosine-5'-triphosphate,3'-diphosphate pyrophosphatase